MTLNYTESAALEAGASSFIQESGSYIGKFTDAKAVTANTGTKGFEFSFETDDGMKANYLTVYYEKADGSKIKGGFNLINAIMGVTKTPSLNTGSELSGKAIGLSLQKVLYTKNDGGDGYKFEIRIPYIAQTKQTLKEALSASQPETFSKYTPKDRDERGQSHSSGASGGVGNQDLPPVDSYGW